MQEDERVTVITAAMCQGNKLEKIRASFPDRFFDVGICESHAVAFAAGLAKAGIRPIVDIYSTFLQRSFDQIFQEVALQNLPVTFTLDRSGLTGPDGPTHHGVFDTAYMRLFPNFVIMAPGDELDVAPMLRFALGHKGPASLRYPKANLEKVERAITPIELGTAEVLDWGDDVILIAYGTLLSNCVKAAEVLRQEGVSVGVVNARFVKPLDRTTIVKAIDEAALVVTVEEGTLEGGFGSAVLEAAKRPTQRGWADRMCCGWGCRTISWSTRSEANCWRTWGWMWRVSVPACGGRWGGHRRWRSRCRRSRRDTRGPSETTGEPRPRCVDSRAAVAGGCAVRVITGDELDQAPVRFP
jgi:1-deoxy-D-xylulose-5-phosphate synthase